jgi:carboxymethylenebutenolidase
MFWNQRLSLTVVVSFALLVAPVGAETIKESTDCFLVDGKAIPVECFAPGGEGVYPAVLLLHGSDGMKDSPIYRYYAGILARHGYVALIVHYFERTGTKRIDPKDINDRLFRAWMDAVRRGVLHAAGLPEVDGKRIGLLGFSLGAYLSLAVGGQGDLSIAAVVDLFGGLPKKLMQDAKELPPTLIMHGDADKTVPVAEARALEQLLKSHRRTYEMKIYEGQDHLFKNAPFGPAVRDAQERALAFLAKHLKPQTAARGR